MIVSVAMPHILSVGRPIDQPMGNDQPQHEQVVCRQLSGIHSPFIIRIPCVSIGPALTGVV